MIEVTAWAPDRATAVAFMTACGIAKADDETGDLVPLVSAQFHPQRANEELTIVKTPAVIDPVTMAVVTPAVIVPGWHCNVRYYGDTAAALTDDLTQTDAEGRLLPLFERTHILDLVHARTGEAMQAVPKDANLPAGYALANGVRLFDPSVITNRRNVWA